MLWELFQPRCWVAEMMEVFVRKEKKGDLEIKAGIISRAGKFVMSKCEKELIQSISRDCVAYNLENIHKKKWTWDETNKRLS